MWKCLTSDDEITASNISLDLERNLCDDSASMTGVHLIKREKDKEARIFVTGDEDITKVHKRHKQKGCHDTNFPFIERQV